MFNKIIKEIIELSIIEFKKPKNRTKIEAEILSPIIEFILEKIKPYILFTSIFLITIILLVLSILYLILISK